MPRMVYSATFTADAPAGAAGAVAAIAAVVMSTTFCIMERAVAVIADSFTYFAS